MGFCKNATDDYNLRFCKSFIVDIQILRCFEALFHTICNLSNKAETALQRF